MPVYSILNMMIYKMNIWYILVLLCKANLECKEIYASELLKPPVSTLLSLEMFYIPDLALRYKKPIYSSSVSNTEEH